MYFVVKLVNDKNRLWMKRVFFCKIHEVIRDTRTVDGLYFIKRMSRGQWVLESGIAVEKKEGEDDMRWWREAHGRNAKWREDTAHVVSVVKSDRKLEGEARRGRRRATGNGRGDPSRGLRTDQPKKTERKRKRDRNIWLCDSHRVLDKTREAKGTERYEASFINFAMHDEKEKERRIDRRGSEVIFGLYVYIPQSECNKWHMLSTPLSTLSLSETPFSSTVSTLSWMTHLNHHRIQVELTTSLIFYPLEKLMWKFWKSILPRKNYTWKIGGWNLAHWCQISWSIYEKKIQNLFILWYKCNFFCKFL